MKKIISVVLAVTLFVTVNAQSRYFRSLTVDHTKVPNTQQLNFPVLVSGTFTYLKTVPNGGKVSNANGYDILFTSDSAGKNKLSWEVERYNPATGELVAWVKVDTLSPLTDKTFYIQYGDNSISAFQGNITGTWTNGFQAVYHLKDGTTLTAADATASANNGTINGATATTGFIAGGGNFVRSGGQNISRANTTTTTYPLTISAWFNAADVTSSGVVAGLSKSGSGDGRKLLYVNAGTLRLYAQDGASAYAFPGATVAYTANTWFYGVAVFNSQTDFKIYQNGGNVGSSATSVAFGAPNNTYIGRDNDPNNYFNGKVDEVRFSNVARSADWIRTEYNNQSSPATFTVVGVEKVQVNLSPVANAGTNQTIQLPVNSGILNASASTDPDGVISSYLWSKVSGPATFTITNPAAASTTATGLVQGTYVFRVKVTDNQGASDSTTVQIVVNAANQPPVANAGSNLTIQLPVSSGVLDATASVDNDGTINTYLWSKVSGPAAFTITNTAAASTTATGLVQGTYVFRVKVTDNQGASDSATVQIIVHAANQNPVANAGSNQSIQLPANTGVLNASASNDPDGTISSYLWTKVSGPATYSITNPGTSSTTATGLIQGTYVFQVKVTDNQGASDSATVQVTVNPAGNLLPVANAGANQTIQLPVNNVTLDASASTDPDGTISSYLWAKVSGPATYTITTPDAASTTATGLVQGTYVFRVKVTDNQGASDSATVQIIVNPANQPPVANAGSNQNVQLPANSGVLNATASVDNDGTISSYLWSKVSGPATFTITNPAIASTTVTGLVQGTYVFRVKVTDNQGEADSATVQITVLAPANVPPTANAGSPQTVVLPVSFITLSGSGTDADGTINGYAWSQVSGPNSTSIVSPSSASTVVTNLIQGTYIFRLTVTDNNNATGTSDVTITVNAASAQSNKVFLYRAITIDHSKVPNTNQMNFPVLVSGTYSFLKTVANGGKVKNASGYDIQFTADTAGTTKLSWDIERYNPATGELIAWVKTDLSPVTDKTIYLQYGDSTITTFQGNVTGTWSNGYAGVYHLKDGVTLNTSDATAGANNATNSGATATTAQIGGGASLVRASAQYLSTATPIVANYPLTISAWFNAADVSSSGVIAGLAQNGSGAGRKLLYANGGTLKLYSQDNGSAWTLPAATTGYTANTWFYGVAVFNSQNDFKIYQNGGNTGSSTTTVGFGSPLNTYIGRDNDLNNYFNGKVDEVRYSSVARSSDWIKTEYNNQSSPATFYLVGNENSVGVAVNAGTNQSINLPVTSVSLSGSATSAGGAITSYAWTMVSGPATPLPTIVTPSSASTNVTGLIQGVYVFRLTVNNNAGGSGWADVTVTVNPPNNAPTANAGSNQTVTLPVTTANLAGTATDPDGNAMTYSWTVVSGPNTPSFGTPATLATTVNGLIPGIYVFRLTATDIYNATGTSDLTVTVNAAAGFGKVFNFRSITIDHNKVPNTVQSNFPVLVSGTFTYLKTVANGGKVRNVNGFDIMFTADSNGKTKLNWEIERYNPATGELAAWVKTDLSPSADKVIYIQYGDSTITAFQGNVTGTWDNTYASVYHLKDGTTLNASDATINASNGTIAGATAATGKIAGGAGFGQSKMISVPTNPNFGLTSTGTLSAWVNTTDNSGAVMSRMANDGVYAGWEFCISRGTSASSPGKPSFWNGVQWVSANSTINDGSWHYIAVTFDGSNTKFYKDGQPDGTVAGNSSTWNNLPVYLGTRAGNTTTADLYLAGTMDEHRISLNARTADWIKTEYNNQSSPATFYAIGAERTAGPQAIPGANQTILLPATSVILTGTGTSPSGLISAYAWTMVSGPNTPAIASPASATTKINGLVQGVYVFRLTVTDNLGATGSGDITVRVNAANIPPVATAGSDQTILLPVSSVNLSGSGTAPNGEVVAYGWTLVSGPNTPVISAPASSFTSVTGLIAGSYVFRLTVTDNMNVTGTSDVNVTVKTGSILDPTDPVITYNGVSSSLPLVYPNTITKWVRTVRMSWNTDSYKCYIYNNVPFRLKFPRTYNPTANDGKKYPMLIFWHGLGEAGSTTDNEYSLYHGGDVFNTAVNNGTFDGYIIVMQSTGFWGGGHYAYMKDIIDYMVANNKLDPFQVMDNGLSAGGAGTWEMFLTYPTYIAGAVPMSSCSIGYKDSPSRDVIRLMPVWAISGGADYNPAPSTVYAVQDALQAFGDPSFKYTMYPDLGHNTWDRAWTEPDFWPFMKRAYKSNPTPLFGRTEFCPSDSINVTLALTPGFDNYEWRKDGVLIPGANSNSIVVTQKGTYDARIQRGAYLSDWSHTPVQITTKAPTIPPSITVAGLMSRVIPAPDTSSVSIMVPDGYTSYNWQNTSDTTNLGTNDTLTVSIPGDYKVRVTEQFGCASAFSAPFKVVNAAGPNKPSAASELRVSALTQTSLLLNWSIDPSPLYPETNFEVYQATQSGGPYKLISINPARTNTDTATGLNPKTKYYFIVRAVNNSAAAPNSNEASGTTTSDTEAPSTPTNLTVLTTSMNSVSLKWNSSTDNVGVTNYDVYVNGQKYNVSSDTTFNVYPLTYKSTYTFYVKARDLANNTSAASNQVSAEPIRNGLNYRYYTTKDLWSVLPDFTTLTPDSTGVMPNVKITPRSQNDYFGFIWEGFIKIPVNGSYNFRTNSDDGSKLYLGALNGTSSPYSYAGTPTVNNDGLHGAQDATSSTLTLTAGIYPIAITFFEQAGGESMTVSWKTPQTGSSYVAIPDSAFTDAPVVNGPSPADPSSLVATPASYKSINLNWIDNSNNETGFEIWRSQNQNSGFVTIGTAPAGATTYSDSASLNPATTYYYKIRALGQYGESNLVDNINITEANWKLNNNYNDSTGNGHALTAIASPVFDAANKMEGTHSLLLNGTTQAVTISNTNSFLQENYSQRSIAFWMRSNSNTGNRVIFDAGGSDDGLTLLLNSNTLIAAVASNNVRASISAPYTSTGWNHIALVYSGNSLRLFVNGTQVTYTTALTFNSITTTTNGARIGQTNGTNAFNTTGVFFSGWIDNIRIMNKAISAADISNLMNNLPLGQSVATTLAQPAAPAAPTSLVAAGTLPNTVNVTWTDNSADETGFELYRSSTSGSNYFLVSSLPANTTSYTDTGLFAHAAYYYQVRATGSTGNSVYSNEDSAVAGNNKPVISQLSGTSTHYDIAKNILVAATDKDGGDVLTFSLVNAPAFAAINDNLNRSATLVLNPTISDTGVYNNVSVIVNDGSGGKDTTTFNVTVNDNFDPVVDSVANYTMQEGDSLVVNLHATDQNAGDVLTWSASGAPDSYTIVSGSNGNAAFTLKPGYATAGVYNISYKASDGKGGEAVRTFTLTVTDKDPSVIIYSRVLTLSAMGAPWNNLISPLTNNLVDSRGNTTNVGLSFQPNNWFSTYYTGPQTGNNSGVYPDPVLRDYYYFGMGGGPDTVNVSVTGLDTSRVVNLTFFGASNWSGVPDNGTTVYSVGNQSVSLKVQNNIQNTATLYNLKPAADGTIVFKMSKGANTTAGYLNALVVTVPFDDGTAPTAPANLTGQYVSGQGVRLNWQDIAYNETTTEVYRSGLIAGPYSLVGTINGTNVTSFIDTLASGNTQYYYKVRAVNRYGASGYTNIFSIFTPDRVPQINPITTVSLKNNQTLAVNVTAIDDASDHITLTATGLPAFATLTDNGNGTGVINITPSLTSIGIYSGITVTARDNSDSSRSTSFDIVVTDKDVSSVYVNFSDGSFVGGKPWNNFSAWPSAGTTMSNLLDDNNQNSGMTVTVMDNFEGLFNRGMHPGNGKTVYAEPVMRTAYFETSTTAKRIKVSGLSQTKKYNFVFFNSHDFDLKTMTNFTINGQTVSLDATYNNNKTVQINGITPDVNGEVMISIAKAANQDLAAINTLVIQGYNNTATLLSPTDLRITATTASTIKLQWADRAFDETGYQIWRATAANGSFTLLNSVAAGVTTYTDQNLTANSTYYYIVRAVKSGVFSAYTSIAYGSTVAYTVYVNFNSNPADVGALPWNNTNSTPTLGTTWKNFVDDKNIATSTGMQVTRPFSEVQPLGMNTGNNSGIYPDNILKKCYFVFPGAVGGIKLSGLNIGMQYDLTVFGSVTAWGDANTVYTVNGKQYFQNASLNIGKGTLTIYGLFPDNNGEINFTVDRTINSPGGYLTALILSGYTPPSNLVPVAPLAQIVNKDLNADVAVIPADTVKLRSAVAAYPNPFTNGFTLSVPAEKDDAVLVTVFNSNGQTVFNGQYNVTGHTNNQIPINAEKYMSNSGMYIVRIYYMGSKESQVIKMMKQQ